MKQSDEFIKKAKNIIEKIHGREFTWEEATEAYNGFETIVAILCEAAIEEHSREQLLAKFPKGFHIDGNGSCMLCNKSVSNENSWYDKYGLKCMICQKAINTKVIPGSTATDKESWYSLHELGSYFNIKGADLKKYIKQSILKSRIIQDEKKNVHLQIFLIKDNKGVLPPKNLLESRTIKVMHNGEEYFTQEPWYEYIDLNLFERLRKKYRIFNCLQETFAKPIDRGRFLYKNMNPLFLPRVIK